MDNSFFSETQPFPAMESVSFFEDLLEKFKMFCFSKQLVQEIHSTLKRLLFYNERLHTVTRSTRNLFLYFFSVQQVALILNKWIYHLVRTRKTNQKSDFESKILQYVSSRFKKYSKRQISF